jgi:hypothetical protein
VKNLQGKKLSENGAAPKKNHGRQDRETTLDHN